VSERPYTVAVEQHTRGGHCHRINDAGKWLHLHTHPHAYMLCNDYTPSVSTMVSPVAPPHTHTVIAPARVNTQTHRCAHTYTPGLQRHTSTSLIPVRIITSSEQFNVVTTSVHHISVYTYLQRRAHDNHQVSQWDVFHVFVETPRQIFPEEHNRRLDNALYGVAMA
jgi:hypothetical protein